MLLGVSCPVPADVPNADITSVSVPENTNVSQAENRFSYPNIVTYTCNDGYEFANTNFSQRQCTVNGILSGMPPVCLGK